MWGLNAFRDRHPITSLGSLFQCFVPSKQRIFSSGLHQTFCFVLCIYFPGAVTGHHWEESGSILLTLALEILLSVNGIPPLSLLQAKQTQFSLLKLGHENAVEDCQKPSYSQDRQHPLPSPPLSIQLRHSKRVSHWSSMISLWWTHAN